MTDTGAYSDVVFCLFRLLGYRFSPRGRRRRHAVVAHRCAGRLRIAQSISEHRLRLQRIALHWDDMLRLAGSFKLGRVPASGIMRTLQVCEQPTRLAQAIAEYGRIDETLHTLRYLDDEAQRPSVGAR